MSSLLPVITDADRRRLGSLLTTPSGRAWGTSRTVADLETILDDASCVPWRDVPESLVTMNSTVLLVDLDTGAERTATLVYPHEGEDAPPAVSVTTPLGVALLGAREGDMVEFRGASGDCRWRLAEIVYQPEHADALER